MARGGIASRLRRSEESRRPTYRLNGVQTGSRVAECMDRARRWHVGPVRLGTLRTRTTTYVWVLWDGDELVTRYSQGDARYYVDTNQWRIASPTSSGDPLSALALTSKVESAKIDEQPAPRAEPTEERVMQPKDSGKTYGAKQVATRIGTDPRTFRKFLRSPQSPVRAVGQGKRYDFPEADMPKIAAAFRKWQQGNTREQPASGRGAAAKPSQKVVEEDGALELDDEPSLDELEDIELELEGDDVDDQEEV